MLLINGGYPMTQVNLLSVTITCSCPNKKQTLLCTTSGLQIKNMLNLENEGDDIEVDDERKMLKMIKLPLRKLMTS